MNVPGGIEKDVLGLDIPVRNVALVGVADCGDRLLEEEVGDWLWEAASFGGVISGLDPREKVAIFKKRVHDLWG